MARPNDFIRSIGIGIAFACLAHSAGAQTPTGKLAYPLGLERDLEGIALSTKQHTQMDSLAEQYWLRMNAMSPVLAGAPRDKQRKALEDQRAHLNADVERILTKDQIDVFRKKVEARAKRASAKPAPSKRS